MMNKWKKELAIETSEAIISILEIGQHTSFYKALVMLNRLESKLIHSRLRSIIDNECEKASIVDALLYKVKNAKDFLVLQQAKRHQQVRHDAVLIGLHPDSMADLYSAIDLLNAGHVNEEKFAMLKEKIVPDQATNRSIVYALLYRQRYENDNIEEDVFLQMSAKYNLSKDKIKREFNQKHGANSSIRVYEIGETNIQHKKTRKAIITSIEGAIAILKKTGKYPKAVNEAKKDLTYLRK